jgi:hypothetical protein
MGSPKPCHTRRPGTLIFLDLRSMFSGRTWKCRAGRGFLAGSCPLQVRRGYFNVRLQSMSTSVMRMYNPLISTGVGGGGLHLKFPSGNFNLAVTHARSSISFRARTHLEHLCLTTRKSSPSEVERTSGESRITTGGVSSSLSSLLKALVTVVQSLLPCGRHCPQMHLVPECHVFSHALLRDSP